MKVHVGEGNTSRNRAYPQISKPVEVFIPFLQQIEWRCRVIVIGDCGHIGAEAASISKLVDGAQVVGIQLRFVENVDVLLLKAVGGAV